MSEIVSEPEARTAATTTDEQSSGRRTTGVAIRLEGVTKRYPGQDSAAVDSVSLDIPAGEMVMFVGPSGCGKTTLLKMLNRLIEPTSGKIFLGDEDATAQDPDELRRRIGYVIQAGGLFPHMTVATNVGMVPKMLKLGQGQDLRAHRRAARPGRPGPRPVPGPLPARALRGPAAARRRG